MLACAALGKASSEFEQQWASVAQRILGLGSLLVAIPFHWVDYHRSQVTNGVLLFFWLFEAFFNLFRAAHFQISLTYEGVMPVDHSVFMLTAFQSLVSFLILGLEAGFQKPVLGRTEFNSSTKNSKTNPYDTANIFSRISFSWMTQMMRTGYEKYLTEADLYKLPASFGSADISKSFDRHWDYEMKHRAKPVSYTHLVQSVCSHNVT